MKILLRNRLAKFNYESIKEYEAGIVLVGTEVKSLIKANGDITNSFAIFKKNEIYLLNMHIRKYKFGSFTNHDENRSRKLLLHRKEINYLAHRCKLERLQIIPVNVYIAKKKIKVRLALAKGKKMIDKRRSIQERELQRRMKKYY